MTVLLQAEIKGSTASISLRSRQHCQFLTIALSLKKKQFFEKELIKVKRLTSVLSHMISKGADLEKISLLVQWIMIYPTDFIVSVYTACSFKNYR